MSLIEVEQYFHSPFPTPAVAGPIGGRVKLFGYSLQESTGTSPAQVNLYDSTAASGWIAVPIPLTAGQGAEDWFGPQGLTFRNGLFIAIASGSVLGSIFIHNFEDRG